VSVIAIAMPVTAGALAAKAGTPEGTPEISADGGAADAWPSPGRTAARDPKGTLAALAGCEMVGPPADSPLPIRYPAKAALV
jgi:hypothetical protein